MFEKVEAQNFSVHKQYQLFLGFTGGMNFSKTTVGNKYAVLVPTSQSSSEGFEKEYGKMFKNPGKQFGLDAMYGLTRNFSIVSQVTLNTTQFRYLTNFSWRDTVENMDFSQELLHVQKLTNIHVPILVRWDMSKGQFTPYLEAGVSMDFRNKAFKQVWVDNTIDGEVKDDNANKAPFQDVTEHFNRFNFGLVGGGGVSYFTKFFVVGLEANFSYGLRQMVSERNRFSDFSGFTTQYLDVFDNLKFSSLNFQLSFHVPIYNMLTSSTLRKMKY